MSWDAIGALGEIIGAVAVFATLFYLAKQVRQQNKISEFEAVQSVYREFNELNSIFFQDGNKIELLSNGLESPDQLSDIEAGQFQYMLRNYQQAVYMAYKAFNSSMLSVEDWHEIARSFSEIMHTPGGVLWRETNPGIMPDFFDEIERHRRKERRFDWSLGRRNDAK